MESIWEQNAVRTSFKAQDGNKSTDVLIIGGGIAGLLCAYKLKSAGVDFILTEAREILSGTTKNTTAKISVGQGLIYDKLIRRFGEDKAKLYLNSQIEACKEYSRLSKAVDCDYEIKDSYVYSLGDKDKLLKEISALRRLGLNAELAATPALPIDTAGAVLVKNQAEFNPLKFLYKISERLPIYEHTKVQGLKQDIAVTNHGEIRFKRLIVATHFPFINKHGGYFLKLYQHRSYVIAIKGVSDVGGIYIDESDTGLSFRNYKDILLLGGGGHRTGKQGGAWRELEAFAKKHYKGAKIVGKWAAQDCMTLDEIPYVGKYSKATPNIFVATGFNKWGMTNAMAAANILTDLIIGNKSPYEKLFSPSRSIFRPQLAANIGESFVGLITPTAPRCPHLGCALKYNKEEHSWDCPCHGSRFTEDGELIDNPATDDKKNL